MSEKPAPRKTPASKVDEALASAFRKVEDQPVPETLTRLVEDLLAGRKGGKAS